MQAGWFPEWTLTEDFALGIELKKLSWQCRYVSEYLAVGEAPEEVSRHCGRSPFVDKSALSLFRLPMSAAL